MAPNIRRTLLTLAFFLLLTTNLPAQVATGSITGFIFDNTGAPMSGATVLLLGENLIGGEQRRVTDRSGMYRFERLPPGVYELTARAEGHKTVRRTGIIIDAAFTATVSINLEEGSAEETITVEGSSTVDTKGIVQQSTMDQDVFEGVPTGRDPWSVGKNVPSSAVGVYDVGGTQGMQQTSLSAHGSNSNDKLFAMDGQVINWPGSGGGSTMLYYGHGMFEQSNYTTSGVPAEALAGGVYISMITKEGGNTWKGDMKYYYSNDSLQAENHTGEDLAKWDFPGGNPVKVTYDFNVSGGGFVKRDKLWVFGAHRWWRLDRLTLGAKNPDGTPAIDDNRIRNYMGKATWQVNPKHKVSYLYNFNDKQRFHRRDTPPDFIEDRASLRQENPAYVTHGRYTGVFGDGNLTVSAVGGLMKGTSDYYYQDEVLPTDIRREDDILNTATVAAQYLQYGPCYRSSITGDLEYFLSGLGGDHLIKGGFQYGGLQIRRDSTVNGDHYLRFDNGVPTEVEIFNTPSSGEQRMNVFGLFLQDSWVIGTKLSVSLGFRFDTNRGWIPEMSLPAGTFIPAREYPKIDVTNQSIAVWRTGIVYDPFGDGKTAIKASASRYGRQTGLGLVRQVNPSQFSSGLLSWNDINGDEMMQPEELGPFEGFEGINNRYDQEGGPDWPYSDEFSLGIDRELFGNVRVGVVYFHRTNRKEIGYRNESVPPSAYTEHTVAVPGGEQGPGGTATFYDMDPAYLGLKDFVYRNEELLDTTFNGVDINIKKRMSNRWAIMGGLTFGANRGGVMSSDLNDPNIYLVYPQGIVGNDAKFMTKFSGTYMAPWDITISGTVIYNNGYPYQSQYRITRSLYPDLTRSSQVVTLSERGEERFDNVFMVDVRFSRPFDLGGGRYIEPQIELFNINNTDAVTRTTTYVGSAWLRPAEIIAPRIIRFGFSLRF